MHAALRLAASCTLLLTLSGPLLVPPVIYGALSDSLNIPQAHVTALVPVSYAFGSLVLTMPGSLYMERHGLHRSFVLGVVAQCLLASAQVASTRLWHFVLLQFCLGACHCFAGTVGFIAFCNAWFGEQPSTAIAINFAAFGVAGTLWTPVTAALATALSWRAALAASASAQWCVALPLAVCAMRDPPPTAPVRRPSRVAREPSLGDAADGAAWWVADGSVWLLALLSFCVLFVTYSVNNSATLFFADEADVPLGHAALFTTLIFAGNTVAKLASGPLLDGPHGGACAAGACTLLAAGSAVLWSLSWRPTAGATAVAFALVFGLGYGGSYALVQSKAALHFGHRRGFKSLQGFLFCWQMAGQISGELVTPELAHALSYTAAFGVLFCLALGALGAIVAFEVREAVLARDSTKVLAQTLL